MYRICIEKSTGKLIEMQSGGYENPDSKVNQGEYQKMNLETLMKNAINVGYKAEEIEVKFVTEEEWAKIGEANRPKPTYRQLRAPEYPNFREWFLDSQVKKASPDPAMQKDGLIQEKTYFDMCLAVKKKYPKP